MRCNISPEKRARTSHTDLGPVEIYPEEGESLKEATFYVVKYAILSAPTPKRFGLLRAPAPGEDRLTPDEEKGLRSSIADLKPGGSLKIDYFKGSPIKLFLLVYDARLVMNLSSWGERIDESVNPEETAREAILSFESMLRAVNQSLHPHP